jgi:methylated-DNA-[protein]-cysteine S-methyltransferase
MAQEFTTISVFETDLGWMGLLGKGREIMGLTFGHAKRPQVHEDLATRFPIDSSQDRDWNPAARRLLMDFAKGKPTDFTDLEVELHVKTDFQRKVLMVVQSLDYGEVASYGDIATRAGAAGAARAVGTVMANNRIPIIIPCHRVVASANKLGGYSAPSGLDMKKRLLAMEAKHRPATIS